MNHNERVFIRVERTRKPHFFNIGGIWFYAYYDREWSFGRWPHVWVKEVERIGESLKFRDKPKLQNEQD